MEPIELTFLGSTSINGDCPTLYATNRGTYVVQGLKLDADVLARMRVPDHETAVEIPVALVKFAPAESS